MQDQQDKQKCSLCGSQTRKGMMYVNEECQHAYCKRCVVERRVENKYEIQCFVPNCTKTVNVEELNAFFVKLQLQQIGEIEQQKMTKISSPNSAGSPTRKLLFDCGICKSSVLNYGSYILGCKHIYHQSCLKTYISEAQLNNNVCPQCMTQFELKE